MLVFNCTMSKKGSWFGTCDQSGRKVCSARNGEGRKGIWSVLAYTLVCESEKVHLWVSKNACLRGVQCRETQGEAVVHKQLLWKGMGVGNCAQSFFSFCCKKKINRPFNLCSPRSLLYWPFISSFPSQLFTSSTWLMNMQMYNQFCNSLSFLKTGYKFGS